MSKSILADWERRDHTIVQIESIEKGGQLLQGYRMFFRPYFSDSVSVQEQEKAMALLLHAPDLLESLQSAMDRIARMAPHAAVEGDGQLYQMIAARGAIRKVTGKYSPS